MKKTLSLILALVLCLSLCACGKSEKAPATPSEPERGTRSNPYKVGDVIEFEAQLNRYEDYGNPSGIVLNTTIVFNESYHGDEVEALYAENYITSNVYPSQLLPFTVSVSGDYDKEIYAENLFFVVGLTKDMKEDSTRGTLADNELKSFLNLYTGVEYSLYRTLGTFGDDVYELATITYEDAKKEEHTIWIDIT